MRLWALLTGICLLLGCRGAPPEGEPLRVAVPEISLTTEPLVGAPSVASLRGGAMLYFLGEISENADVLELQGTLRESPYLKVQTGTGKTGWIFAGALSWDTSACPRLVRMLGVRRAEQFLGKNILEKISRAKKTFESVRSQEDFARAFREAADLQKDLAVLLNEKRRTAPPDALPDWFWVNDSLRGLLLQNSLDGQAFEVYRDFQVWETLARHSTGTADDQLIRAYLMAFPEDSIEFEYPAWRILADEHHAQSLLGRGIHLAVLRHLDASLLADGLFRRELMLLKQNIIDDIANADAFWESPEKVLAEFDAIVKDGISLLDTNDYLVLGVRRNQLVEYKKHGISMNGYAGGAE